MPEDIQRRTTTHPSGVTGVSVQSAEGATIDDDAFALLRRAVDSEPADVLRFADLTFDLGSMEARRDGRRFELTTTEAHLLELFMRNPRQVLPRSLIYERVWGYDFSHSSNALDVYVGYLRRKLEAESEQRLIHTVRGTGYVLREQ